MDKPAQEYHSANNIVAACILEEIEACSAQKDGEILKNCGATEFVVRGSGAFLVESQENLLFARAVGDLDLKVCSPNIHIV